MESLFCNFCLKNVFLENVFQYTFHEFWKVCFEKKLPKKDNPEVIQKKDKTLFEN